MGSIAPACTRFPGGYEGSNVNSASPTNQAIGRKTCQVSYRQPCIAYLDSFKTQRIFFFLLFLNRDLKDLNAKQTKTSADTAKEVQNYKTLKTKNEKDRRLREKRQNNIKRFMEEKKVRGLFNNLKKFN